jgi:hypothetical protein
MQTVAEIGERRLGHLHGERCDFGHLPRMRRRRR